MTPQQIADKIFPNQEHIHFKDRADKLVELITTLQKETWDQACKAQREAIIAYLEEWYELVTKKNAIVFTQESPLPPFNLEK